MASAAPTRLPRGLAVYLLAVLLVVGTGFTVTGIRDVRHAHAIGRSGVPALATVVQHDGHGKYAVLAAYPTPTGMQRGVVPTPHAASSYPLMGAPAGSATGTTAVWRGTRSTARLVTGPRVYIAELSSSLTVTALASGRTSAALPTDTTTTSSFLPPVQVGRSRTRPDRPPRAAPERRDPPAGYRSRLVTGTR